MAVAVANMSSNQVTLAKYKSPRLRDPLHMADEYVAIDECDYSNYPVLTISSDPGSVNGVILKEVIVDFNDFAGGLLSAFFENYRYFRCRSIEVTYTSTDVTVDYRRVQAGVYWTPDHYAYDNNLDAPINSWAVFMEKPNTSMINYSGGRNIFKIRYVPQIVAQDDIAEDEPDPNPDVVFQVRGDQPMGWLSTTVPNKSIDLRGPMVVFRRPYSPAGNPSSPEVSYSISVRTVWEFKKAKNGN